MAKDKKVKGTQYSEKEWLSKVGGAFDSDKSWRSPLVDKSWYINRAYYSGYQTIKYDPRTGSLYEGKDDPLRFYINMIYPTVRTVRAAITRNNPVFDVDGLQPGSIDPKEREVLSEFMGSLFEKLGIKEVLKETVYYGLLCGLGIMQYGFDSELDDGEGELWVNSLDPFDVYFGGQAATGVENADRITKVMLLSMKVLKQRQKDGIYKNVDDVKGTNELAESSYKKLLQEMQKSGSSSSNNEESTVLVKETWWKEGGKIFVVTWVDGTVLRVEESTFKEFPFVLYFPDVTPGVLYNEGWVKPLVPLNKAINYLQRKILKYNISMASGKYVTDSDTGVDLISNESGEIIVKQPGSMFEAVSTPPLSSTPFNQLNDLYRLFQDTSGVQEAMMGRAPTGVTAAIAFEELVANSLGNMADLIDNLTMSIENLGNSLLSVGYESYTTTKPFVVRDRQGHESTIRIGGKDAMIGENEIKEKKAIRLPEKPNVRIKVTEGVAYTKQGKQQTLFQLRAQGDLDRRTLLQELGLDANEIEVRILKEQQGIPTSIEAEEMLLGEQEEVETKEGQEVQQAEVMEQGGQAQQAQPGVRPNEDTVKLIEEFVMEVQSRGLQLDPVLYEDVNLLLSVIDGRIDVEERDGMLVPLI